MKIPPIDFRPPRLQRPRLPSVHLPPALARLRLPNVALPKPSLPAVLRPPIARVRAWVASLSRPQRIALGVGSGVLAVAFVTAGTWAFLTFYGQYGYHPDVDQQRWASIRPRFAIAATCGDCHASRAVVWADAQHSVVPCQTCHGPMEGHEKPGAVVKLATLTDPNSRDLCASCHAKVQGRPSTVKQVDVATHYTPANCALCHDPHTTSPIKPPGIPHPLANLPECQTCHARDALQPIPATHPVYQNGQCRSCHVPLKSES